MKEMSSTSPRITGAANFDINVEDVIPAENSKYLDSNVIFESLSRGRQFLPPPAAQAEKGKWGDKKIIFQKQILTWKFCLWHATCKFIGHRFTANEVPNYSEEGLH